MDDLQRRQTFPAIPRNEIPAVVPFRLVLARSESLALWISNIRVYSTGMTFSLEAGQRNGDQLLGMYGFGKPEAGYTPPMLFGIEDSAGTISTNLPKVRSGLRPDGGGGDLSRQVMHYSLTPLPAPGSMSIHFAWPHFGIAEKQFKVDANAIREAADEVIILWPLEEAESNIVDFENSAIPQIEVPPGGWFQSAAESQRIPAPDLNEPRRSSF